MRTDIILLTSIHTLLHTLVRLKAERVDWERLIVCFLEVSSGSCFVLQTDQQYANSVAENIKRL